ncbi:MAG: hypothetical protein ACR2MB_10450 [Acidimicrobiales bacterium]
MDTTYEVEAVDVVVNGQRLDRLWAAASGDDGVLPMALEEVLAPGHRLWVANPNEDRMRIEDGRTAVLTCSCGNFGCGGATARIGFTGDRVRWEDFHYANFGSHVDLGPFNFARDQYEAAVAAVTGPTD